MNCQLIQRELVKVVQLSISDIGYYSIKKYKQDKIKPVHDTVIILEDQQDLWIELSTQETSEKVQLILNKAIQKLSHSVKIWLNDGNKEQEKLMLKFNYYKEPLNLFLIVQIFGMNLLVYQVNKKQLQYSYVKQLNIFLRIYHFC
ncbi:unnamed protein product [Paramecium pentaurelia]|uniref:Uncharacterized protein n=1 Tax=Paramecium pentaurelia TaxID=43138 RepID=A0A8S1T496_9CILI|nr:unnamed protein product [Paramecium pentaurelia]